MSGARYYLLCYDDASRHLSLYPLKKKSEALANFQRHHALVETQLGIKIRRLHSDKGGEFLSKAFAAFAGEKGFVHTTSPTDAHNANRVERAHRTVLDGTRTILYKTGLAHRFWLEAAAYIVYSVNHAMGKNGKVPEDVFQKRRVRHDHLQPFGRRVSYRNHGDRDKLKPNGREAIFVGYEVGTNNYRVYDKTIRKVVVTRDVDFRLSQPDPPPQDGTNLWNVDQDKDTSEIRSVAGQAESIGA